jgi:hypothetical protein
MKTEVDIWHPLPVTEPFRFGVTIMMNTVTQTLMLNLPDIMKKVALATLRLSALRIHQEECFLLWDLLINLFECTK